MTRTALHASSLVPLLALVVSCANDEARNHVFQSSPPPPAARAVPVTSVSPIVAEPPLGSSGPSARIVSVRVASTGAPGELERVTSSLDVVTLVSRGRGSSPTRPARIELRVTGVMDTTLVEPLASPVPIVVSHSFRLSSPDGSLGLPSGRYQLQVRLVGAVEREVASVPVFIGVQRP